MKLLGIILIILSLSKLGIAGSSEDYSLSQEIYTFIKGDIITFHKRLMTILIVDGIIGLICGICLL